jgi:predicted nuclease of restriction endonuclease-like (RecB) superfamily
MMTTASRPSLVFRNPYLLDFLSLKDTYSECGLRSRDPSGAGSSLLELGTNFAFVRTPETGDDRQ